MNARVKKPEATINDSGYTKQFFPFTFLCTHDVF